VSEPEPDAEPEWVCIPWVPADRNEPAREFLFDLVPAAVSRRASAAGSRCVGNAAVGSTAEELLWSHSQGENFVFIPVMMAGTEGIPSIVEEAAPRFFLDLVQHIQASVRLALDTIRQCSRADVTVETARELLQAPGAALARYLLPERIVAGVRRASESELKASISSGIQSATSNVPRHFQGIGFAGGQAASDRGTEA